MAHHVKKKKYWCGSEDVVIKYAEQTNNLKCSKKIHCLPSKHLKVETTETRTYASSV
jgi:hypothetical protein